MADDSARGGEWVMGQFVLLAAILVAPRGILGIGEATVTWKRFFLGLLSVASGVGLLRAGGRDLGNNLTPYPRPRRDSTLVQEGVYGVVRHPLYTGLTLCALGWSLLRGSTPALLLTVILAIFFDRKAALEETWLVQRFPEYASYRQRVAKLIPWLY